MEIQTNFVPSARRRLDVLSSKTAKSPVAAAAQPLPSPLPPLGHRPRTLLVNVPFVSAARPSIQLGLLKAIGQKHGFEVDTLHLNLDFSAQLGSKVYETLCDHRGRMFGDWLFALAAFGELAPDQADELPAHFAAEVGPLLEAAQLPADALVKLRREAVPRFLAHVRESIRWQDYDVIGFTSTFQQTVAAAAVAREARAVNPQARIVFGGANLDGDMGKEVVRIFPVIDYGVSGEADTAFPALLASLEHGEPSGIPGVIWRRDGEVLSTPPSAPLGNMDELPMPDYDEFFARMKLVGLLPQGGTRDVRLPFESSRGCWWGAKKHCTFCGLNGATMKYRSKSPERVATDLASMSRRYRTFQFEAVDNIMDHKYYKELLPKLADADTSYDLFYEIKSNVGREELRLLHQAGVRHVQPGIESLSTPVLKLMRKGVRASQNVNLMRWARYYGIGVAWNLIYGFPGEQLADYERQTQLMKHLLHLQPPTGCAQVWLERFSPLYRERDNFPAARIAPEASYSYVYPRATNLDTLAYFFDYELQGTLPVEQLQGMRNVAGQWSERWQGAARRPTLTFFRSEDFLQIDDARGGDDKQETHTFEGPLALVYQALSDAPLSISQLIRKLGLSFPPEAVKGALDEFCRRGLMLEDEGMYLSLALPAGTPR
ncbi:MAG: hypothetical protein RL685_6177 [Pseudomonadota bacterium]